MKISLCTVSVRGPRNVLEKKPNQDAVIHRYWGQYWCVVVCDGMGSKTFSDMGSALACKAVYRVLKNSRFDLHEKEIAKQVYSHWLQLLKEKKLSPQNAATTCLFAWGNTNGDCRLFQLGDGAIFYQTEHFDQLSMKENFLFSNQTNALGYSKSWEDWSYKKIHLSCKYHSIALMTDGISDDLLQEQEFLKVLTKTVKGKSVRQSKKYLTKELHHWPTPKHSDDKSIGLIYWEI